MPLLTVGHIYRRSDFSVESEIPLGFTITSLHNITHTIKAVVSEWTRERLRTQLRSLLSLFWKKISIQDSIVCQRGRGDTIHKAYRTTVTHVIHVFNHFQTTFSVIKLLCEFSPRMLVEQWFTWDQLIKCSSFMCSGVRVCVRGHCSGVKSANIYCIMNTVYTHTYKPYYSPRFVSDHSINSCVSENCKNVKHVWVRGQTRPPETNIPNRMRIWGEEPLKTATTRQNRRLSTDGDTPVD